MDDHFQVISGGIQESSEFLKTEILVIGSGPGGAMTAYTLAGAGKQILMLDAGELYKPIKKPSFSLDELQQKYWGRGLTFTNGNPKVMYAMGRCVGGGSEVNNGEFPLVPEEVLDNWIKRFQVKDISYQELTKHREFSGNKLSCDYESDEKTFARKLRNGAEHFGWKTENVPRCFDTKLDESITMTKSFIPDAINSGCKLLPSTKVDRLTFANNKWTAFANNKNKKIRIECETVFLCAGAVQSALILKRSGIAKNSGRLFQSQPMVKVTARFPDPVNEVDVGIPSLQVKEFAPKFTLGCSVCTLPYIAVNLLPHLKSHQKFQKEWQHYVNYYAMITPESVGRINRLPGFSEPMINYPLNNNDINSLGEAMSKLCQLLWASGAEALYPSIASNSYAIENENSLNNIQKEIPRHLTQLTAVHLSSACPMGENRKLAVVDSFGKVFDTNNLFVSDVSTLCTAPSVNPQATIMALARRNALRFLNL